MAFINSIDITKFRGIQKLEISEFSNINLIVGDNNSGKTTFLEAIQLLFAKSQLSSIKNVINQRTVLNPNSSFYTSFIKMFNKVQGNDFLEFDIYAFSNKGFLKFELNGRERQFPARMLFKYQHCQHARRMSIEDQQRLFLKLQKSLREGLLPKQERKL